MILNKKKYMNQMNESEESESKSEGYHFWAWPLTGRAAKRGVPPACAPTAAPREAGANMGEWMKPKIVKAL